MRRISILLVAVLFTTLASAQSEQTGLFGGNKFAIKVEPFHGSYMSHNYHFEKFRPFSPKGVNFGFELPSLQQRPWQ